MNHKPTEMQKFIKFTLKATALGPQRNRPNSNWREAETTTTPPLPVVSQLATFSP